MASKTKDTTHEDETPTNLPAITEDDLRDVGFPTGIKMAPGLALFMNDRIYTRCRNVAADLARADAIMPDHLKNKPAAVFAVISVSITWNLSPILVARCTYQTPGGGIGFMGVLVQAILENSGQVVGNVKFELVGEWAKIRGRFKMVKGDRGKDYAVADWKPEDEIGLGVIVSAQIRGEEKRREETFYLNEFNPRFSTLWATRPWQQIRYTAVRAFANIACPGLLMGLPFDVDPVSFYGEPLPPMTDVTPRAPQKNEFERQPQEGKRPEPGPAEQPDDKKVAAKEPEQKKEATKPEPERQPDKEPSPPTNGNEQLEREAAQADASALQGQEQQQTQPDPVQEEQRPETEAERKARHDNELKDWYGDMKKLIPGCRFVRDVTELRESVMPNLEGDMAKEFSKLCDERQTAILEATRPGAKRKS